MNFEDLESFVAVVRRQSFTLAAKDLHLSQPAISRQVRRLEEELGVELLDRRRSGVCPTSAGQWLLAFAEDVLTSQARLVAELRGTTLDLAGELRIAASTTPGEFLVPDLLLQFKERFPRVNAHVLIADSAEVATLVAGRSWELGFTGALIERPHLIYRIVAQDEVVLVAPAKHRLAARGTVELEDLEGEAFVEREGGSGTLMAVRQALAQRGLTLPKHRVIMTLSTTQAVVTAVQRGAGVGFVSKRALAGRVSSGIVALQLAGLPIQRPLFLVYDEQHALTPVARAFLDFLAKAHAIREGRGPSPDN